MKYAKIIMEMRHDYRYVNFKSGVQTKKVHKKEFYNKIKELADNNFKQINHTTIKAKFKNNSFAISERGSFLRLTWRDNDGDFHQYYTNFRDDKKNDKSSGSAIGSLKKKFKERTGEKFIDIYGKVPHNFKRVVPGLFHFDNPLYIRTGEKSSAYFLTKLDFSSHFPACACGELPTANDMLTIDGYAEPNAEYPFAFYPDNGFCAEYGKFNSWDWYATPYKDCLFHNEGRKWEVHPARIVGRTILMKAADYQLDPEMQEYYHIKESYPKGSKERDEAKQILLKVIGQMERNENDAYEENPYAHLAAIIKARAFWKMFNLVQKIGENNILEVIVDGVIFKNIRGLHYEDKEEFLGSLKLEKFNAKGDFRGHNQYILWDDDGVDMAHAGYDIDITENIMDWKRSPSFFLKESINDLGIAIEDLNEEEE